MTLKENQSTKLEFKEQGTLLKHYILTNLCYSLISVVNLSIPNLHYSLCHTFHFMIDSFFPSFLSGNALCNPGGEAIGHALMANHTLTELHLSCYLRQLFFFKYSSSYLRCVSTANRIVNDGAGGIAQGLRNNSSLKILILHGTHKTTTNHKMIFTFMFMSCVSTDNRIEDKGAKSLGDALMWNHTLKTLRLDGVLTIKHYSICCFKEVIRGCGIE